MLDVLPPAGGSSSDTLPSTVKIDWKLPARLRRPVGAELRRQRVAARRGQPDAIAFKRHALYPADSQQHTADVHRAGRAKLRVSLPPYAGHVMRRAATTPQAAPARPAEPVATHPAPTPKHSAAALTGERDIPFDWQAVPPATRQPITPPLRQPSTVAEPPRRLALPLHLSFWPFRREPADRLKKKVLQRVYG